MPRVAVRGVPSWVPVPRLLGDHPWSEEDGAWVAELDRPTAADVQARLRGLGMGGQAFEVQVRPSLKRALVREARTRDARRRRRTTPGFLRAGVRLDDEARASLTPEALALALGERAAGRSVFDATCGAGGNAIGFARAGCRVTAVDLQETRIRDARHNAVRYGVADRITFVSGSALDHLHEAPDLVFVDPPWGRDYDRQHTPLDALPLLRDVLAHAPSHTEVWAKVPPSFDPRALPSASVEAWFGEAEGDRQRVKFVLLVGLAPDLRTDVEGPISDP